jgi:hypothetical protein
VQRHFGLKNSHCVSSSSSSIAYGPSTPKVGWLLLETQTPTYLTIMAKENWPNYSTYSNVLCELHVK